MQTVSSRPFLRLATIGALIAALGLAACGRKGYLDPPPSASAAPVEQAAPSSAGPGGLASPVGTSPFGGSSNNSDTQPTPKGPDRKLPLDVLLN